MAGLNKARPVRPAPRTASTARGVKLRVRWPRRRWVRYTLIGFGVPCLIGLFVGTYLWVSYGRMIDERLGGEARPIPRIFGRP